MPIDDPDERDDEEGRVEVPREAGARRAGCGARTRRRARRGRPPSSTERERWASPPSTRSIATSAIRATTGAAITRIALLRGSPSAAITTAAPPGREGDRGADVGAEAPRSEDQDREQRRRPRRRSRRSAADRPATSAVTAAPAPSVSSAPIVASSSLPIPKKRTPRPGFGPISDSGGQRRAREDVDRGRPRPRSRRRRRTRRTGARSPKRLRIAARVSGGGQRCADADQQALDRQRRLERRRQQQQRRDVGERDRQQGQADRRAAAAPEQRRREGQRRPRP